MLHQHKRLQSLIHGHVAAISDDEVDGIISSLEHVVEEMVEEMEYQNDAMNKLRDVAGMMDNIQYAAENKSLSIEMLDLLHQQIEPFVAADPELAVSAEALGKCETLEDMASALVTSCEGVFGKIAEGFKNLPNKLTRLGMSVSGSTDASLQSVSSGALANNLKRRISKSGADSFKIKPKSFAKQLAINGTFPAQLVSALGKDIQWCNRLMVGYPDKAQAFLLGKKRAIIEALGKASSKPLTDVNMDIPAGVSSELKALKEVHLMQNVIVTFEEPGAELPYIGYTRAKSVDGVPESLELSKDDMNKICDGVTEYAKMLVSADKSFVEWSKAFDEVWRGNDRYLENAKDANGGKVAGQRNHYASWFNSTLAMANEQYVMARYAIRQVKNLTRLLESGLKSVA